jgi:hypothetical protein
MWRGGQRSRNADPLVSCLSLECRAAEPSGCEGFALSVRVTEEGPDILSHCCAVQAFDRGKAIMPSVKPVETTMLSEANTTATK